MQAEDQYRPVGDMPDHAEEGVRSQLPALVDVVLGISASLDPQNTLDSIVQAAAALSGAQVSSIWLQDADGRYRPHAAFGVALEKLRSLRLGPDEGLIGQVRQTRRPMQVVDFERDIDARDEALEQVALTGVHATVAVPLVRDGDIVGALYAARTGTTPFADPTVDTLERLAAFAQVALLNAQRYSRVEAERSRLQAYLDAIPEGVIIFDREGKVALVNQTLEREIGGIPDATQTLGNERIRKTMLFGNRVVRFRYDPRAVFRRVLATGDPEQGLLEIENPLCTYEVSFNALRTESEAIEGVVATLRDITVPLELERERSRSHLLTQLLDLSAGLNSTMSVPALLERVTEVAMDLLAARSGMIGLIEGDRLVFRRVCLRGQWTDADIELAMGEGLGGHVWRTGRPYVANRRSEDPHVGPKLQERFGFARSIVVPIVNSSNRIIATLHVHDPMVERDFGRQDVEALQLLGHQAAIAVENARLSEMKDEFLSIVSHELKTPITSIKGFVQVLHRRLPPDALDQVGRYLDILAHQSDRLTSLINDLLDLSRIQRGHFQFDIEAVDYSRLLTDVVAEMQLVSGAHRLVLDVPDGVVVWGNGDRLRQVLVNLIDNAFKYGPPGGTVCVLVEQAGDDVATVVTDEGTGVPMDEAERIFSQYYQIREGPGRVTQGMGLGLYVSRQIVEAHAGRIWMESKGQTRFCFTVPAGPRL